MRFAVLREPALDERYIPVVHPVSGLGQRIDRGERTGITLKIEKSDRVYLGRVLASFKDGKHFTTGAYARNLFGDPVPLRSEDAHAYDLCAAMTVVALNHSFPVIRANEIMALMIERDGGGEICMQQFSDRLGWKGVKRMIEEMIGGE